MEGGSGRESWSGSNGGCAEDERRRSGEEGTWTAR